MQVSKKKVSNKIENKIFCFLYQVLADLKKSSDIEKFLNDVLSKTEKTVVAKRLAIAWYLNKGESYDTVRKYLKVSSATIANVQKLLDKNREGLNLAFNRIDADYWAGDLAKKIVKTIKKIFN